MRRDLLLPWRGGRAEGALQEYALIFGSPVPAYAAPQDTVGPATRIPRLMMALLGDALAAEPPVPEPERTPSACTP